MVLTDVGYKVDLGKWGLHNFVITSIKKVGVEQIPQDKPGYAFGYDDPRNYFPDDLVCLLDKQLPQAGDGEHVW